MNKNTIIIVICIVVLTLFLIVKKEHFADNYLQMTCNQTPIVTSYPKDPYTITYIDDNSNYGLISGMNNWNGTARFNYDDNTLTLLIYDTHNLGIIPLYRNIVKDIQNMVPKITNVDKVDLGITNYGIRKYSYKWYNATLPNSTRTPVSASTPTVDIAQQVDSLQQNVDNTSESIQQQVVSQVNDVLQQQQAPPTTTYTIDGDSQ